MSVDLSGLLYIQKDYLYDLSAIAVNDQPVGVYIQDLQSHLGRLYTDFSTASITSQNVVNNQAEMNSIVQTEQERLLAKKQEIDSRLNSQNRLIELNDSYRKKQEAYLYIIFVIIISLILIIICLKLRQILPYPMIAEVFIVLIVFFTCIYLINKLWQIFARDKMNYDNIVFSPPDDAGKVRMKDTTSSVSQGGADCRGNACCVGNTIWNPHSFQCDVKCPRPSDPSANTVNFNGTCIVPGNCPSGNIVTGNIATGSFCVINPSTPPVQGFTLLREGGSILPYTSNEHNQYSPYK